MGQVEAARQHADDRVRLSVELNDAIDDGGVGTELALPECVADDGDLVIAELVLTGQEPMRVRDLLEMLAEILGVKGGVEFVPLDQPGHYVRTPYAYEPRIGRKYVPPMHVDLGQGLLQLIEHVQRGQAGAA